MANLKFMQTAGGNFRIRRVDGEGFTEEYDITTAQWKAILDIVGVAASVAAGTADTEATSPNSKNAGSLSPTNYS